MGKLTDDLFGNALPRLKLTFPHDLPFARKVMHFEQHALIQRRRSTIQAQVAASGPDLERPETYRRSIVARPLAELDQLVGVGEDLAEPMAERLTLTEPEKILCRQIDEVDDEILIETDQGDPESTENAVGAGRARLAFDRRR